MTQCPAILNHSIGCQKVLVGLLNEVGEGLGFKVSSKVRLGRGQSFMSPNLDWGGVSVQGFLLNGTGEGSGFRLPSVERSGFGFGNGFRVRVRVFLLSGIGEGL